ncbi:putative inner membrane protein [Photobacterium damselae subsp. piscicida]|uniref:AI-2E family transporter n=1 Tax=Photobacterium damsela subsp. piscicida TaxID=38294 RepID=L7NKH9_PHODP|nr:AI-2E family transporter [Photobacterium damselae]AEW28964.1 putative permease [Photobacterium damselae subsp. piscicida]MBE8130113.1 AI-2E family transporter [Photobacterium damselae subsp. piscicida]MDP2532019.1 AI-2E family transporter [Photobacterium damselae subsp. piscicida]MDP2568258.1 AI-2E family transporter [Photobacterium damselae subsp. piscicida]PSV78633.1 AI-2E family transporter [Photobacterium damselae]
MSQPFKVESRHWMLVVALIIAGYASYRIIEPYLGPIIMAVIISLLCHPMHEKIRGKMPGSPNIASLLSCTLLTFIIMIPMLVVFSSIVHQGTTFSKESYTWLTDGGAKELFAHPYVQKSFALIDKYSPFKSIDPQEVLQKIASIASQLGSTLLNVSTKLLGDVTNFLMSFILMLFVLFFLLRDHDKMVATVRNVLPLSRSQEDALFSEVQTVAKSAVLGSFMTALAQGVAGGFAMWLCGFPGLFWGSMMAFASFIPVVGTALIWVPVTLYLLLLGQWEWALFLTGWGIIVVGSIDNVLRPLLMQGGDSNMNTLLIFFSILGGLQLFGLIGLIYGPIIFGVTLVLFKLYEIEFKDFLEHQDRS